MYAWYAVYYSYTIDIQISMVTQHNSMRSCTYSMHACTYNGCKHNDPHRQTCSSMDTNQHHSDVCKLFDDGWDLGGTLGTCLNVTNSLSLQFGSRRKVTPKGRSGTLRSHSVTPTGCSVTLASTPMGCFCIPLECSLAPPC